MMKKRFFAVFALLLALALPAFGAMSDEEFIELCESGTAQQVEDALKAGANVNAKVGWTALMAAVGMNGNLEVITALINAGANVNADDGSGMTALMGARNPETVVALINAGADVNAKIENSYDTGKTVLMLAAQYDKNPEVITALVNAGADINARNEFDGKTALDYAREENNTAAIKVLEAANANKNQYERVNYEDVARYPERYQGKRISFSGSVSIIYSHGFVIRQNNSSNQRWWATYQRQQGEGRILEDDHITVYGVGNGIGNYELPAIHVDFFE